MANVINNVKEVEVTQEIIDSIKHISHKDFAKEAGTVLVYQYDNGAEIVLDLGTGSGRGIFAQGGNPSYGDIVDLAERGAYLLLDGNDQLHVSLDTGEVSNI